MLAKEAKMHGSPYSRLLTLAAVLSLTMVMAKTAARPVTNPRSPKADDFDTAIKQLRDTWVREFNAGHADKVADLYAQEAVLMRRNGSVHNRDSILSELKRSIAARANNYTVQSLHSEHSGDLGYDTGVYNENLPHRLAEGNYLIVVKKIDGDWKIMAHAVVPNPEPR
jgi:ketosteroid isomerase-like protein